MSMQFHIAVSEMPEGAAKRIMSFVEGEGHPLEAVMDIMIADGHLLMAEEIPNWQGWPEGAGNAELKHVNIMVAILKQELPRSALVNDSGRQCLAVLKAAARGQGKVSVIYD